MLVSNQTHKRREEEEEGGIRQAPQTIMTIYLILGLTSFSQGLQTLRIDVWTQLIIRSKSLLRHTTT